MGKLKNLDITFEKIPLYPGQLIKGHLEFLAKDSVSIRDIVICFKATSKSGWNGDGSNGTGSEHLYYRVEQPMKNYLNQNQSSGKNGSKSRLPSGAHKIPFSHVLTSNVPGSFGGKHGYVYHCCRAVITTAGNSEIRVERPVPVIGKEDLNLHPYAAMPFSAHESFKQRALCLKMADHTVVIQLPRTGYCPGEVIKISGEIVNRSSRTKIRKCFIQLIQSVQYSSSGSKKKKVEMTVVAEASWGEVNPGDVFKLEEEKLPVPALPPSFLRGCDDIDIAYELQFNVEPGNRIDIPIIIGTVPYTEQSLKKYVRALPWKTGSDLMSKKGFEAAGLPIPPKIDGKFPHPHFPPRMPPPPPNRPGGMPPPPMGGIRPPPYPGVPPPRIGIFRPPPPQQQHPSRPRPRPGFPQPPGAHHPRGPPMPHPGPAMPGVHARFPHPPRPPGGPLPRGFPPPPHMAFPPPPPGVPMPPPPPRKPSAQGPYVTEVSDNDGESVISKRKESDSARPHGVLKIEEIE